MKTSTLPSLLPLALLASTAAAQTSIWTGNGNANASGDWSSPSNWSDSVPGAGSTAVLDNVTAGAREVTYDATASGSLGSLSLLQTTAGASNAFLIKRDLVLDNNLTIGASAGSALVHVGNAAAKNVFTVGASGSGQIAVNSGGKLVLDFATGTNLGSDLFAHVTVNNGGVFQVGSSASGSTGNTAQATLTRSLTLGPGASLVLDTATRANVRLAIQGNVVANGATISTTSGTGGSVFFDGASVSLTDTNIGTSHFTVRGSGAKTFTSDGALNRLYLVGRNNAAMELTLGAPSATGLYLSHESANQTVGFKLSADLSLANNAVQLTATGGAASGTTTYTVDPNGHTLDLSLGQNFGKLTPNKGSEASAVWELRGTSGGRIVARGFDFSTANVQTNIGAGLVLEAVSGANGASQSSNLSGSGDIDATSVFRFNPVNPAHPGTLESGRDIGVLEIAAGKLQIVGSADFAARGGIVVAAGAKLDLGDRSVAAPSYTFGIQDGATGLLIGGAAPVSLADTDLVFRFSDVAAPGEYSPFDTAHGFSGGPASVSITGAHVLSLDQIGRIWSGTVDGFSFSFSAETGTLVVGAAIPEPSTAALLLGGLALAAVAARRRVS